MLTPRVPIASLLGAVALAAPAPARADAPGLTISVDASEAPVRKIFHAKITVPARPGPLVLHYPKWIPGEHGPTGPINGMMGLRIAAGGRPLSWRRDDEDMYAFHVDVPDGAKVLEVALDFAPPTAVEGFSAGASVTPQLAILSWNQVLVYPDGAASDDIVCTARLKLPAGWKFATALPVAKASGSQIEFLPASLTTLVDSPVLAGAHLRSFPISAAGAPPQFVDIVSDSPAALEAPADLVDRWKALSAEAAALFGATHFRAYHFLFTLSNQVANFGLEHHESSDDRLPERAIVDEEPRLNGAGLLPHEFVHSWNGKYRRPAGLATPAYHQPMKGDLLWVYEGLTTYLGNLLTARSGLWTAEQARDQLALTAAEMDHTAGRAWRPLADTAVAAQIGYASPREWRSWRRGVDFYPESHLIWLEADAIIRRESKGLKSLDDFCKAFHGPPAGPPAVSTYGFDDVVTALAAVQPYDWKSFLRARLNATLPRAPTAGLGASGWKLVYNDAPTAFMKAAQQRRHTVDATFSLGVVLREDGGIIDVVPGLPAAASGVAPGGRIVAVNGRRFSSQVMRDALRATRTAPDVDLLVESNEFFRTHHVRYRGGERYPHLERDASKPDLLTEMWRPQAKPR